MTQIERKKEEDAMTQEMMLYGKDIIRSGLFRKGLKQTHHKNTSLGDHTLDVTITALRMSHALKKVRPLEKHLRSKDIIQGSLCHDLAMVGRYEKYSSEVECCMKHPSESAQIAKEMVPDLSERSENMIEHHMWPANPVPPSSLEGVLLVLADKYCTFRELAGVRQAQEFEQEMRRRVLAAAMVA